MQHGDAGGDAVDRQPDLHELLAQGLDKGLGLDQAAAGTLPASRAAGRALSLLASCDGLQHSAL